MRIIVTSILSLVSLISCSDSSSTNNDAASFSREDLSITVQSILQTLELQNEFIDNNFKDTVKGGTDYTNRELDQWWDYEIMLEEDFRMLVQILNSSTSLQNEFCENQIDEYITSASSQFNKIKAKSKGFGRIYGDLQQSKDDFNDVGDSIWNNSTYVVEICGKSNGNPLLR
jgi:hypothetical protein